MFRTIDGAVRTVTGLSLPARRDAVLLALSKSSSREFTRGVRYGRAEVVELLDVCDEEARLLLSEVSLPARASSMTAGSSSVMPFSISAKMAIKLRNSVSVSELVEKRAYSYCARNLGPSSGGMIRP